MTSSSSEVQVKRDYHPLGPKETFAGIVTWGLGIAYSLYSVFTVSKAYSSQNDSKFGWFGFKKDTSDAEWQIFSRVAWNSLPWMMLQVLGSQYFKYKNKLWICYCFNTVLSVIYLLKYIGVSPLMYLLIQPLVFFAISRTKKTILIWTMGIWFILGFTSSYPTKNLVDYLLLDLDSSTVYVVHVTASWINIRCISYALDIAWNDVQTKHGMIYEFIILLSFCFYIPVCIGGPIILYKTYNKGMEASYSSWSYFKVLSYLFMGLRYALWFFVADFACNFLHFNNLQSNINTMINLDTWTLAGIGYAMGAFFHLKYLWFYGIPRPFLLANDIEAPPHPKCVSIICLYSEMWRHFDSGLYQFLHKYIYSLLNGTSNSHWRKLLSSTVSFSFIYIWHGRYHHVLVWSVLNWLVILIETIGKNLGKSEKYQTFETSILTPRNQRRFHALLVAPLYLLSLVASFYFFMQEGIGSLYFFKSFYSWPISTPLILFFMYAAAQTSIEAKKWKNIKVC